MLKSASTFGVEERRMQKRTIRVTSPARTVVDCFVYRNKIGLDVAFEGLRDCRREKLATMDEIYVVAKARDLEHVETMWSSRNSAIASKAVQSGEEASEGQSHETSRHIAKTPSGAGQPARAVWR